MSARWQSSNHLVESGVFGLLHRLGAAHLQGELVAEEVGEEVHRNRTEQEQEGDARVPAGDEVADRDEQA